MSNLNLYAIASQVVHDSTVPDPAVMAVELVNRLDPADYREALLMLSRDLIRSVISRQRTSLNGGTPAQGSRKVAAARAAWKRVLETPEFLPSTNSWIFLKDATHDQVLEMAGARRQKSMELRNAAERYTRLAKEMSSRSVMRVSDLPEDLLANLLNDTKAAA